MLVVGKLDAIHLRSINRPDSYGILTIKLLQHWRRSADHTNGNCIVRIRAHSLLTQQPLPAYQRTESISTLWTLSLLHLNGLKFHNYCLNLTLVDLQLSLSDGGAAESEGFEPPVHCCTTDFKSVGLNHSPNSPYVLLLDKLQQVKTFIKD